MIATPQKYLNFLNYLTTVFDNVEDLIALMTYEDGEYRLVLANESFAEQARQSSDLLPGKLMRELFSAEQFAVARQYYEKVRLEKRPLRYESAWPDGRLVAVTCYPVENALGEPVYLVTIGQDISRVRQEEIRRHALEAQLELFAASVRERMALVDAGGTIELATGDWFGTGAAQLRRKAFDGVVRLGDGMVFERVAKTLPIDGRPVFARAQTARTDGEAVAVTCEFRRERGKAVARPWVSVVVRADSHERPVHD